MNVLVTGSNGFIGKNLCQRLLELPEVDLLTFDSWDPISKLAAGVKSADVIFHLAGVNRPENEEEFDRINAGLTTQLCQLLSVSEQKDKFIIFSSSIQAEGTTPYGLSKKRAEEQLLELQTLGHVSVLIYRLQNVFGKWTKPNYNSVVATFCVNALNNKELRVDDPEAFIELLYVDDLIDEWISEMKAGSCRTGIVSMQKTHGIKVGELASRILRFKVGDEQGQVFDYGEGFDRALYATYLSYKSPSQFIYDIHANEDARGVFAELVKHKAGGQFSLLTALPGVTRGNHYHHTKNEKFVVVVGTARFDFIHLATNETYECVVSGDDLKVVETCPGWAHAITNIGSEKLVVFLWANEIFDSSRPDTYHYKAV